MKNGEKTLWLLEQGAKADTAIRRLIAAKKQRVSEYDERLRKLKSYSEALYLKREDSSQMELVKEDEVLTPDLAKLLEAPLRGLD
jgi:hypothetical protein